MLRVKLVERIDGDWCAYVEGQEEDAVTGPTGESALGRLVKDWPGRFGIGEVAVASLDQGLSGEPGARTRGGAADPVRIDAEAPEVHDGGFPGN